MHTCTVHMHTHMVGMDCTLVFSPTGLGVTWKIDGPKSQGSSPGISAVTACALAPVMLGDPPIYSVTVWVLPGGTVAVMVGAVMLEQVPEQAVLYVRTNAPEASVTVPTPVPVMLGGFVLKAGGLL